MAHAEDLRMATKDAKLAEQFQTDWRKANLEEKTRKLLEYAEKVTKEPASCTREDIANLRAAGCSDTEIHDAVQVIAYFNYINRVVDALGCDFEPDWQQRR
ncbi:MAG: peroxidase-related enzyme [Acidobacteriota bacterium]